MTPGVRGVRAHHLKPLDQNPIHREISRVISAHAAPAVLAVRSTRVGCGQPWRLVLVLRVP